MFRDRDYQRAADRFPDAVLSDPTADFPKLLFGHALFAVGDYDYASYAIRRAIDRIDDLDAVSSGVDDLYGSAGRFERLVYKLHDHARRHALDEDAHFRLGYFRYFAGDYEAALRSFDRALLLNAIDSHAKVLRELTRAKLAAPAQPHGAHPPPRSLFKPTRTTHRPEPSTLNEVANLAPIVLPPFQGAR